MMWAQGVVRSGGAWVSSRWARFSVSPMNSTPAERSRVMCGAQVGCLARAAVLRGTTRTGVGAPMASQTVVAAWVSAVPVASLATKLAVAGATTTHRNGGWGLGWCGSLGRCRTGRPARCSRSARVSSVNHVAAVGVNVMPANQPAARNGSTSASATSSAPPAAHTITPTTGESSQPAEFTMPPG